MWKTHIMACSWIWSSQTTLKKKNTHTHTYFRNQWLEAAPSKVLQTPSKVLQTPIWEVGLQLGVGGWQHALLVVRKGTWANLCKGCLLRMDVADLGLTVLKVQKSPCSFFCNCRFHFSATAWISKPSSKGLLIFLFFCQLSKISWKQTMTMHDITFHI